MSADAKTNRESGTRQWVQETAKHVWIPRFISDR
jgi:hypothetical protein